MWSTQAMRKVMYGFVKNKVVKDYTKELYKRRDVLLQKKFLATWVETYNDALLCKPLYEIADTYRKKKAFDLFNQKRSLSQISKLTQDHFKRKALLHYLTNQKIRGIK